MRVSISLRQHARNFPRCFSRAGWSCDPPSEASTSAAALTRGKRHYTSPGVCASRFALPPTSCQFLFAFSRSITINRAVSSIPLAVLSPAPHRRRAPAETRLPLAIALVLALITSSKTSASMSRSPFFLGSFQRRFRAHFREESKKSSARLLGNDSSDVRALPSLLRHRRPARCCSATRLRVLFAIVASRDAALRHSGVRISRGTQPVKEHPVLTRPPAAVPVRRFKLDVGLLRKRSRRASSAIFQRTDPQRLQRQRANPSPRCRITNTQHRRSGAPHWSSTFSCVGPFKLGIAGGITDSVLVAGWSPQCVKILGQFPRRESRRAHRQVGERSSLVIRLQVVHVARPVAHSCVAARTMDSHHSRRPATLIGRS